ncbi:PH domain-containing protein [Streptomyces sp. NPDC002886]|uniref:PH domain-containing protein n=1 Tax=Streptomyces sp. NPDC002886 TaxID=3364667 RepID=UPI0036C4D575
MEPTSPSPIPTRILNRPGQQVVLFMVGGLFALLAAGMLISGSVAGDPFGLVLYAVIGAGGLWIVFRSCVMGVRIDPTGLTERGLGRSKVVPWCVIGAVSTGDGPGLAPAQDPGLVFKNGERVGLGALASYSSRVVEADFALIKSAHASHVTDCTNCA